MPENRRGLTLTLLLLLALLGGLAYLGNTAPQAHASPHPFGTITIQSGLNLTIVISPAAAATITVNNQTYVTNSVGVVSILSTDNSSSFTISVPEIISLENTTRQLFSGWSDGGTSENRTLTMSSDTTLTATYTLQYLVTVSTPYGAASGAGWENAGSNDAISVTSPFNATVPGTRYNFTAWEGDLNGSANPATVLITKPLNITALWTRQFYLTVDTGNHATSTGAGWYNEGATASFSLTQPQPSDGTWYIFQGWKGDHFSPSLTSTIQMTAPMSVNATWLVRYQTTILFTDSNGTSVPPMQVDSMVLRSSNGTLLQVSKQSIINGGIWLDDGLYQVTAVTVMGVNSIPQGQTVQAAPNSKAALKLNLYQIVFNVHDLLLTSPIDEANIDVALPNGSSENVTAMGGQAIITQLPEATYPYTVTKNMALSSTGSVSVSGGGASVDVKMVVFTSVGIIAGIIACVLVAVILLAKRRSGGKKGAKRKGGKKHVKRRATSFSDLMAQFNAEEEEQTAAPNTTAEGIGEGISLPQPIAAEEQQPEDKKIEEPEPENAPENHPEDEAPQDP